MGIQPNCNSDSCCTCCGARDPPSTCSLSAAFGCSLRCTGEAGALGLHHQGAFSQCRPQRRPISAQFALMTVWIVSWQHVSRSTSANAQCPRKYLGQGTRQHVWHSHGTVEEGVSSQCQPTLCCLCISCRAFQVPPDACQALGQLPCNSLAHPHSSCSFSTCCDPAEGTCCKPLACLDSSCH